MSNISNIVRRLIQSKPLIYEGMIEGVISHTALAENLLPEIEKELGKEVHLPAIIMAIRRYNESLFESEKIKIPDFKFNSEIIMKSGLADITLVKSPTAIEKIKKLYSFVNFDRGDTLNIIHGNYEITIVISEKHLQKTKELLKDEKILNIEKNLVSLSVSFSSDFLHTPGIISKVIRKLAWENINIYENISTMTELIFIIHSKDSVRAYKALEILIEESNHEKTKK
ncbi:MAG: ACT domain-containing protein [Candidatus Woesearchaeota archaeon]